MYNENVNKSSYYIEPVKDSKIKLIARKTGKTVYTIFQVFTGVGILLLMLYLFVFPINIVQGQSMEPNFCDKDIYLTYKLNNYFSEQPYEFGNVVAFKKSEGNYLIKRIVGLPGDQISILNGHVYRNGSLLDEVYLPEGRLTFTYLGGFLSEGQVVVIPKGKYFVLGDNRQNSYDSRNFGLIDLNANEINGRVVFVVWPPKRMRFFDQNQAFSENECREK